MRPNPEQRQPDPRRTLVRDLLPGDTSRFARGDTVMLFERQGSQCRVTKLVQEERKKELILGLGSRAQVLMEPFLPERPLILEMDPQVVLAPKAWVKGYLLIPLGWAMWLTSQNGPARFIDDLPPAGLRMSFLESRGKGYVHPFKATLLPKRPLARETAHCAILPLHLVNRNNEWLEMGRILLATQGINLFRMGKSMVTDPVRILLKGGKVLLQVRTIYDSNPRNEAAS